MTSVETFHRDVVTALRDTLLTVEGLPAEREWQNRNFTPPAALTPWVRYTFDPGTFEGITLGEKPLMRGIGTFLVDWFVPSGSGLGEALLNGGAVLKAFNPRVVCHGNGQAVIVRRSYLSRPRRSEPWLQVPVTVEWYADVVNPI